MADSRHNRFLRGAMARPESAEPGEFAAMIDLLRRSATVAPGEPERHGTPPSDADLLDLCGRVIVKHREVTKAWGAIREFNCSTVGIEFFYSGAGRQQQKELFAEQTRLARQEAVLLRRATKLRATTAAGIYAKALMVRASRTGAAVLAMSLAEDLIGNRTLRAVVWPAAVL